MSDSEILYSARQVTEMLGCSPQMAGKYFQALEKITNTKIKTQGRDGRQFDSPTRDILLAARDMVRSNSGVTVEDAVRRAVGLSQMPLGAIEATDTAGLSIEALKTALSESVTKPLLSELIALRKEVIELKTANAVLMPFEDKVSAARSKEALDHGILVRVALKIEAWLERLR